MNVNNLLQLHNEMIECYDYTHGLGENVTIEQLIKCKKLANQLNTSLQEVWNQKQISGELHVVMAKNTYNININSIKVLKTIYLKEFKKLKINLENSKTIMDYHSCMNQISQFIEETNLLGANDVINQDQKQRSIAVIRQFKNITINKAGELLKINYQSVLNDCAQLSYLDESQLIERIERLNGVALNLWESEQFLHRELYELLELEITRLSDKLNKFLPYMLTE